MTCQEVSELMQRHLDGDLQDAERQQLQNHIDQCSSCATLYERLTNLNEQLENLPKVEPPRSLVDEILPRLAQLDAEKNSVQKHRHRVRLLQRWSLAAGSVAAAIVIAIFVQAGLLGDAERTGQPMVSEDGVNIHAPSQATIEADRAAGDIQPMTFTSDDAMESAEPPMVSEVETRMESSSGWEASDVGMLSSTSAKQWVSEDGAWQVFWNDNRLEITNAVGEVIATVRAPFADSEPVSLTWEATDDLLIITWQTVSGETLLRALQWQNGTWQPVTVK